MRLTESFMRGAEARASARSPGSSRSRGVRGALSPRGRSRGWRRLGLGLACLISILLAVIILGTVDRNHLVSTWAKLAAWERQLQSAPDDATLDMIEGAARRVLVQQPLETRAIRLLALAAEARGDMAGAERLMEVAEQRSRADVAIQTWLFKRRLQTGRLGQALRHLDAILRKDPNLLSSFFPVVMSLVQDAGGARAVADLLNEDPPWRGGMLSQLSTETPHPALAVPVFSALISGPRPPSAAELNPYLNRLVSSQMYERAFLLWTRSLPSERLSELTSPYNGSFEHLPSGTPFDWKLEPVRGARSRILDGAGALGRKALAIEFLDTRVPFQHVKQLLLLAPGPYELQGKLKADKLRTEGSLRWAISCAQAAERPVGAGEPVRESQGWQDFRFRFDIPAEGCRAQWLALELGWRVASEQRIVGQVLFDDLRLERLSVGSFSSIR